MTPLYHLLVISLLTIPLVHSFTFGFLRPEDSQFLVDFYNAMQNKPNAWNITYVDNYDNNPCQNSWEGITCRAVPGNATVQTIEVLSFNRVLNGILPDSIGNLIYMRTIIMTGIGLHGPVPAGFWSLPSLQSIFMANNQLTGEIAPAPFPVAYGIFLHNNQLSCPNATVINSANWTFSSSLVSCDMSSNHLCEADDMPFNAGCKKAFKDVCNLTPCIFTAQSVQLENDYVFSLAPHLDFFVAGSEPKAGLILKDDLGGEIVSLNMTFHDVIQLAKGPDDDLGLFLQGFAPYSQRQTLFSQNATWTLSLETIRAPNNSAVKMLSQRGMFDSGMQVLLRWLPFENDSSVDLYHEALPVPKGTLKSWIDVSGYYPGDLTKHWDDPVVVNQFTTSLSVKIEASEPVFATDYDKVVVDGYEIADVVHLRFLENNLTATLRFATFGEADHTLWYDSYLRYIFIAPADPLEFQQIETVGLSTTILRQNFIGVFAERFSLDPDMTMLFNPSALPPGRRPPESPGAPSTGTPLDNITGGNAGAIAGGVIGGLAVLAIIAVIVVLANRKLRTKLLPFRDTEKGNDRPDTKPEKKPEKPRNHTGGWRASHMPNTIDNVNG